MQDRPTTDELLAAVEHFLDDLTSSLEGSRSFNARVAANAVRIIRRELESEDEAVAAEWAGLDSILGAERPPGRRPEMHVRLRERNEELCKKIRSGDADERIADRVFDHVRVTVRNKLRVSDPELLARSEPA